MIAEARAEAIRRRFGSSIPDDWRARVGAFGRHFDNPFSPPHSELWEWANAITADNAPAPFVALWPRGRGKSTHAEALCVDLGGRGVRDYCIYVCSTQDQADKHVRTIAGMLESDGVRATYGARVSEPKVGRNGSRSWNRRIMTTQAGFTVEAVGLNKAVRGQKIDWARPDLIIFDDVDERHDTELTIKKKIDLITLSILPSGAPNVARVFVQNVIHADSVAAMLAKPSGEAGSAQFLADRIISGPYPAVQDLQYEAQPDGAKTRWVITGGDSLWEGYGLDVCEAEMNSVSPAAFELEYQHNVDADNPNALLSEEDFARSRVLPPKRHPDLLKRAVAVDPPAGAGHCGIVAGGYGIIAGERHGYTLEDATTKAGVSPSEWASAVLACCYRNDARLIFAEVNNGGDMVVDTIRNAKYRSKETGDVILDGRRDVKVIQVRASRGKLTRAEPCAVLFQTGYAHHVGYFPELERQWRTYVPLESDSPDRLDAEVWLYKGLGMTAEPVAEAKAYRYA